MARRANPDGDNLGLAIGAAVAYQAGPTSIVATFDFAYLTFAVLWGFCFLLRYLILSQPSEQS